MFSELELQADGPVVADERGGVLARVDTPDLIHTLRPAHGLGVLKLLSLVLPQITPC